MKYLVALTLCLLCAEAFADSTLVRFVCQQTNSSGKLLNRVVIAEQTSTEALEGTDSDTIDGSAMIDPDGEIYTGKTAFRMRIYNDVSLVSDEGTKAEIVERLLNQTASRDIDDDLMDFRGKGNRYFSRFTFGSRTPYDSKSLSVNLINLSKGWITTSNGAFRMLEDGPYMCEEPVLIPYVNAG